MLFQLVFYLMKLKISLYLFIFIFLNSCSMDSKKSIVEPSKQIEVSTNKIVETSKKIVNLVTKKKENKKKILEKKEYVIKQKDTPYYLVGEPYFLEGIKYFPQIDYNYKENGLATFYGAELHKKRTANNSFNNVTELLGRHKTLPLPSVVKIINLENGLSIIIKINDRNEDNFSIIQVSRKVAQLLRFYKSGFARVRIEILSDPSKQLKIVTESMSSSDFDMTLESAPTEEVSITDLRETEIDKQEKTTNYLNEPIEVFFEKVSENKLFVKSFGFNSYLNAKEMISSLEDQFKTTIQNEGNNYSILFGPLENNDANKLVSSFISKGYKKTEIILE